MKKILVLMMVALVLISSIGITAMATDGAPTLEELVGDSESQASNETVENLSGGSEVTDGASGNKEVVSGNKTKNEAFMDGLKQATDMTGADVPGAAEVTGGARQIAAYIVTVLSYIIIAFLAVRIMLDLIYIVFTPIRTFMANGYTGVANTNGQAPGAMGGAAPYGRPTPYGGATPYGGMSAMESNNNVMGNKNNSRAGNIQFVSNQALNAVANESAIGANGKPVGAFKTYAKDMIVMLIIVPVLVILAATGVITRLGFAIGGYLVDAIESLAGKI